MKSIKMNEFDPNILKDASKEVSFDAAKKQVMRSEVMRFMNAHPLPVAPLKRTMWQRSLFFRRTATVFAVVVLVVIAGAGTTFASKNALPGDALYPFKVHVVEQVKGAFVFDSAAKTEQEIDRAGQRLQEIDQLTLSGKLTPAVQAQAEASVQAHVDDAQKRIADLQKNGKDDDAKNLAARLEATLSVHDQILSRVATEHPEDSHGLAPLQASVSANLKSATKNRAKLDDNSEHADTQHGPDASHASLVAKITAAQAAIEKAKQSVAVSKASDQLIAQAKRKLDDAQQKYAAALQLQHDGVFDEAFASADRAVLAAQEAIVLARTQERVRLDLQVMLPPPPTGKKSENDSGKKNDSDRKDGNRIRIDLSR